MRFSIRDIALLGRLAPATISPASFSGLTGWWKADTYALADGSSVWRSSNASYWLDQSGNGHHWGDNGGAQGAAAVFKTNQFNGLPALEVTSAWATFDGYPTGDHVSLSGDFTFIFVGKPSASTTITSAYYNPNGNGFHYFQSSNPTHPSQIEFMLNGLGSNYTGSDFPDNTLWMFACVVKQTGATKSVKFYKNNGVSSGAPFYSGGPYTFDLNVIGTDLYALGGAAGLYCEMVFFSEARSQTEIQNLYTNYFKPKWGLP